MNSLCIKTNNDKILEYLQNEFSEFNMLNVFYSSHNFKLYKNIIIHYKGNDSELFYTKLATILSYLVIDNFEQDIIKNILMSNYFYFDNDEFDKILNISEENLYDEEFSMANREMLLFDAFYEYITVNRSIVLSGFINFRLFEYRKLLENLVDLSVNEFIIEREYLEFISLVNIYVNSQPPLTGSVHIVPLENDIVLLDENLDSIEIDKNSLNAKYLSDIPFSDNDFILNTLLNLLPRKIYMHISSPSYNLDFINTLRLIFDDRFELCTDCNICNLYKKLSLYPKK